ncbi:flavin monoamine oxidase family protein [Burkholderia stagnalis]
MNDDRRAFLRGAGATMAATAFAGSAVVGGAQAATATQRPSAGIESKRVASGARYDVIVVVGGFAGLTAARDCALRGMKVLLLEARARIGGRTFTSIYQDHRLELGGTWIHWSQPHVWDEITRYGLSIVESPGASPEQMSWLVDGKIRNGDAGKAFSMLAEAMGGYYDVDGVGGRSIFPRPHDPFFREDLVRKYDGMSSQDRLDAMKFTPEMRGLVAPQIASLCHRDPASAAFADQLKMWSLADFDLGSFFERSSRYKIGEGTTGLAHAIAADSSVDIMLSAPVAAIEQQKVGAAVVTAAGARYSADAVICAVPVNVLKKIDFRPSLDAVKLDASRAGVAGQGTKCYIHIRQKIGKWMGCGSFPNPVTAAWTEQERDDGTLLVAFGSPGMMDINDEQSVQAALRTILPGVDVVATTGYQWTADPYSLGTWCFFHPGQMTRALAPLRAREGAIFFASADSALGWRGAIDGAIESGTRVAHKVGAFLVKS